MKPPIINGHVKSPPQTCRLASPRPSRTQNSDPGLIKFAPLTDVFGAQLNPLALRLDLGTTILAFNAHLGGS